MVPEEIRAVKRPTNTVVMDQGTNTPKRYIVRARKCVKYIKGHNPQPVSGEVIGYIMDGKFVPREKKKKPVEVPVFLSWGPRLS